MSENNHQTEKPRRPNLAENLTKAANYFQDPIQWVLVNEEMMEHLVEAQDMVSTITEDLEWLARFAKKHRPDHLNIKLTRRTKRLMHRLRIFTLNHEETQLFGWRFLDFLNELDDWCKALKVLKRDWRRWRNKVRQLN